MANHNWYVELYDLIQQRLIDAGLPNVGPALSINRALPSVEPWIAANKKPDRNVGNNGDIGDPRKIMLGCKITVAKSDVDGGAMRQALGLLGLAEQALKSWVIPVVGIIRPEGRRGKSVPQLLQEESGVKEFNADSDGVWITLFSCHIFVDQWEIII